MLYFAVHVFALLLLPSHSSCTSVCEELPPGSQDWERGKTDEGRRYELDQATHVPCAIWPWLGYVPGASLFYVPSARCIAELGGLAENYLAGRNDSRGYLVDFATEQAQGTCHGTRTGPTLAPWCTRKPPRAHAPQPRARGRTHDRRRKVKVFRKKANMVRGNMAYWY